MRNQVIAGGLEFGHGKFLGLWSRQRSIDFRLNCQKPLLFWFLVGWVGPFIFWELFEIVLLVVLWWLRIYLLHIFSRFQTPQIGRRNVRFDSYFLFARLGFGIKSRPSGLLVVLSLLLLFLQTALTAKRCVYLRVFLLHVFGGGRVRGARGRARRRAAVGDLELRQI
jgi:hypothetical protein